jgi:hypothetical protein
MSLIGIILSVFVIVVVICLLYALNIIVKAAQIYIKKNK